MARGSLKCSRCNRTFTMPAHLARHMSASHGIKKKGTGKRGRPKGSKNRQIFVPGYSLASANGASHVLGVMQSYHAQLQERQAALAQEMMVLADAMATLGGQSASVTVAKPAGRRGPGRPRVRGVGREGSLRDMMAKVLKASGAAMSPKEIAAAVKRAGYRTKASDLTKAVSNAIPKLTGIKRKGYGRYAM